MTLPTKCKVGRPIHSHITVYLRNSVIQFEEIIFNLREWQHGSLGTFGDTNVERKRCTYDVTLTSLTGACPISAFEHRQIRTAFMFYVHVTKDPYYQSTMTSHNDPRTWCHERRTSSSAASRKFAFIKLRNDLHAWTYRNSLTGIGRQWVRNKLN